MSALLFIGRPHTGLKGGVFAPVHPADRRTRAL